LIFHDILVDFYQTGEKGDPIMPTYEFENKIPKIAKTSYVHPQAAIIGDVEIGDGCFIGAGAVLRGDFGKITIGRGTSIQENSIIHVGGKERVSIGSNVIIAHGAILHDVTIKSYVLVGMGSILMTGVFCGNHIMIAAGSVVKENFHIPPNVVVAGNPARIVKPLSGDQRKRIDQGVKTYQELVKRYKKSKGK
jgi:carbonic anhydrase/acetyltransferase-like protein (isoleucine patch superfamily)